MDGYIRQAYYGSMFLCNSCFIRSSNEHSEVILFLYTIETFVVHISDLLLYRKYNLITCFRILELMRTTTYFSEINLTQISSYSFSLSYQKTIIFFVLFNYMIFLCTKITIKQLSSLRVFYHSLDHATFSPQSPTQGFLKAPVKTSVAHSIGEPILSDYFQALKIKLLNIIAEIYSGY